MCSLLTHAFFIRDRRPVTEEFLEGCGDGRIVERRLNRDFRQDTFHLGGGESYHKRRGSDSSSNAEVAFAAKALVFPGCERVLGAG